jgi:hypothetical protein
MIDFDNMKKLNGWTISVAILAALLPLGACTDDEAVEATGSLTVTLRDASAAQSRTLPADLMVSADGVLTDDVAAQFQLLLTNTTGTYRRECRPTDRDIALPLGRFTVSATFGEDRLLAWDAPYYTGTAETEITRQGEQKAVTVPCRMQNALATFQSDGFEVIRSMTNDCYIRIVATDGAATDTLCWRPGQTEDPYFRAGARISCSLIAERTATQQRYVLPFGEDIESAQASTRYSYTLHLGVEAGQTDGLSLRVERADVPTTLTETIPETALPAPKITAVSSDASEFRFGDDDYMEYVETCAGDVAFHVTTTRDITSAQLTLRGLGNLADGTFDLLQLPAATEAEWAQEGLTLSGTQDARHRTLDFSEVISNLLTQEDGTAVDSEITLTVTANGRTTAKTYRIHTVYPEFTAVMDDRMGWTKTLSLAGSVTMTRGNKQRFIERTRFAYKAASADEWTDLPAGTKEVHWQDVPAEKEYQVQAYYRGQQILAAASVKLEEGGAQLPNSGFEEWTDDKYDSNRYSFNPWGSDKGSCHWDTNNAWTTRHRWNSSVNRANYNGFHAVSYYPHDGGWAAELRSTANGRGNTKFFSINALDRNRVAGQLLTGTFTATKKGSDANGNDEKTITKDATFDVRPSGLTFWYQYFPYETDSWRVTLQLLDANGNIIAETSEDDSRTQEEWTQKTIHINFDEMAGYEKCRYIYVEFLSTIYGGHDMPFNTTAQTVTYWYDLDASKTKEFSEAYIGSKLRIDDVELIYDR